MRWAAVRGVGGRDAAAAWLPGALELLDELSRYVRRPKHCWIPCATSYILTNTSALKMTWNLRPFLVVDRLAISA